MSSSSTGKCCKGQDERVSVFHFHWARNEQGMVKEGEQERQGGQPVPSVALCPSWAAQQQLEPPVPREAEEGDLWDEALVEGELLDEAVWGQRGTPDWVVSTEWPFAGNQRLPVPSTVSNFSGFQMCFLAPFLPTMQTYGELAYFRIMFTDTS